LQKAGCPAGNFVLLFCPHARGAHVVVHHHHRGGLRLVPGDVPGTVVNADASPVTSIDVDRDDDPVDIEDACVGQLRLPELCPNAPELHVTTATCVSRERL
jgi:hypothetical protein